MIIGLSGYMGSGKSLAGMIIETRTSGDRIPFKQKGFSIKLKQICSLLTGVPLEKFESQEFKKSKLGKEWDDSFGIDTYRDLLQVVGTDCMRDMVHPNIWVNALMADYQPIGGYQTTDSKLGMAGTDITIPMPELDKDRRIFPNWVVVDCRFPNEAQAIKDVGGVIIRIQRVQNTKLREEMHSSETSLDNWPFDYVIDNNGSKDEFDQKIRAILEELKI